MASSDSVNRKANGTKNLKVHFQIPECEDSISSILSDSSFESADIHKIVYDKKCPTTQMMDRVGGYDPNRIPSDIFSSKPINPMEWSLASNESLFSLHIGNINSFSTLNKSQELVKVNEECMTMDTSEEMGEVVMEKIETSSSAENIAMGHNNEQAGNNSTTIFDHHFDESMVLYPNGSFQFPVLTGNGERNRSETMESEKALEAHSPKSKTAPNPGGRRDWCHCFCFCSPCY